MLVYQRVALNQVTNRKVPLMIGLWTFLDVFSFFGGACFWKTFDNKMDQTNNLEMLDTGFLPGHPMVCPTA